MSLWLLYYHSTAIEHKDAEKVIDMSESNDKSIKGYFVKNESSYYTLYINSDKKIMANEDMKFWFMVHY